MVNLALLVQGQLRKEKSRWALGATHVTGTCMHCTRATAHMRNCSRLLLQPSVNLSEIADL